MVWTREAEDGGQNSSNIDPRHGGSDKARWEAAAMEVQGGARGEKWGDNSTQVAPGGSAGGRLQETRPQQLHQPPDRRHPTPGKRNASPLVGGAESCGAVINLRKWSESVGAKGVLNVAWVNVSNIPLDKRHEKNIAYMGSLVGVTLEIDKATINRPESVRIKLGCRDAEDIPTSAQGVLGGHFYDFFFSVDKILIKNPPRERIGVQQENEEGNAAKKARFNTDIRGERNIASSSNMGESSAPLGTAGGGYGKNVVMNPVVENMEEEKKQNESEDILSEEESEEVGNELLIDTMVEEAEKNQNNEEGGNVDSGMVSYDEIIVNSMQILPSSISVSGKRFLSYLDACMGEPVVTEMDPSDISGNQKMQSYLVQSPDNSVLSNLEIISAAVKMGVNIPDDDFETIDIIRELEISRANIAKKVDKNDNQHDKVLFITNAAGEASPLDTEWGRDEGLDADDFTVKPAMAENVKKGAQLLKESAAQMLRLCEPPRAEASEQADVEELWDEWLYVPFGENFSVYFCALCFG
ncbi:hypothetical protein D1007_15198 [Hordeum vulgare]|nr:hypothetical protein D1007_15198 [Hordeum vulgare]